MRHQSGSRALIAMVIALLVLPGAQAQAAVTFDLPAQPLADSLKAIATQTNTNVLFDRSLVEGMRAPALKADLTPEAAVSRLLEGTGVRHELVNEHTIVLGATAGKARVVPTPEAPTSEGGKEAQKRSFWDRFRLAQVASGSAVDVENSRGSTSGDSRSAAREELEEVVVTAQKREQRAVDVPISIIALDSDELEKRKVTSVDQLPMAVPGLAIRSSGGHQRNINLRGVSNTAANSSLVGIYLDEAPVTSGSFVQPDLRTYDLERVEVLRGPQGTLYGEGSAGGTIRFITNDPRLDSFAMKADTAASFTEDGEPGQRIEAMLNAPVVENELALRIVGTYDHAGGWIDQPAANREDINNQNLFNVRVKALWQPTAQLAAKAMAVVHRNRSGPNMGEDSNGNFTQTFALTTTPRVRDEYEMYNLTLTYDFPAFRALSTTSDIRQSRESSNIGYRLQLTAPPSAPFSFQFPSYFVANGNRMKSQELRLTSIEPGPLQWTGGAYYRDARLELYYPQLYVGFAGAPGTPLPTPSTLRQIRSSKAYSLFGDASYNITSRLLLGLGLRHFEDDAEFVTSSAAGTQRGTFKTDTPRVYAQYRFTADVNAYASAAKGFRSGGFNSLNQPSFEPEKVWTYELGTKMALLDRRLYADVAVFYTDYAKYQMTGLLPPPAPPLSITSNAGSAKIKGIEWAFNWRATDDWTLTFNGDRLSTRFYEINATRTAYFIGDPLDLVPKYQFTLSSQRDFRWGGRPGFARVDYSQQGRMSYRNRSFGPWYFDESDVINMLNLSAGLQWNPSLSLTLFAQNLLDDRGFTDPLAIEENAARSRPRTLGIAFGVTF